MVTPEQLAQQLRGVNVAELAATAGVSTKTIYRLRNFDPLGDKFPSMKTIRKLMAALGETKKPSGKRAKVAA